MLQNGGIELIINVSVFLGADERVAMKNIFKSYKIRILLFICVYMALSCTALIMFAVRDTKNTAINVFAERGKSILTQVLDKVDIEQYARLSFSLDKDDPYFDELYSIFNTVKSNADCKYLYTMKQVSGNNFAYVVDGTDQNDEDNYSEIGTIEDISEWAEIPLQCMKEKQFMNSGLEENEEWGFMLTVYAPIADKSGKVLGFAGIDFAIEGLEDHINASRNRLINFGIIICVVGLVLMIFMILGFFKALTSVSKAMQNISSGVKELTQRVAVPKSTELAILSSSCNGVIEEMQSTMQTVSASVNDVNENSEKIFAQVKQLIDSITNVGTNIEDVKSKATSQTNLLASLDENTHMLQDSIELLKEKANEQNETVGSSINAIKEIIASINTTDIQINNISNEYQAIVEETRMNEKKQKDMTNQIKFIEEQAVNLSAANEVITGIASKTNLLAMNAAIEASHAGEAGKGFSVVASEIRALAENSAKQTDSITNLVTQIEEAVKQIVIASDDSEKAFSVLGHKIENLSNSMNSIKDNMNTQNENATNITSMLNLLTEATNAISSASATINDNTQNVVKGIGTIKFSSRRINETSEKAESLLQEMSACANDTNLSSENNKKAVDSINSIVNSYKF